METGLLHCLLQDFFRLDHVLILVQGEFDVLRESLNSDYEATRDYGSPVMRYFPYAEVLPPFGSLANAVPGDISTVADHQQEQRLSSRTKETFNVNRHLPRDHKQIFFSRIITWHSQKLTTHSLHVVIRNLHRNIPSVSYPLQAEEGKDFVETLLDNV